MAETQNMAAPALVERLASVLPQGHSFQVHHLSTPPTKTDPLHPAPAGRRPDKTYCEHHFLTVAANLPGSPAPSGPVFLFALEIFVFTTNYSTTLFVSKADSTGFLHLLKLPKGTPSPIREVTTAFIAHLLAHRRRPGTQFIVNLFARSQDQYLFPLSIKNKGKHVLDDRGLVKWWARVLDPMLGQEVGGAWKSANGYLLVPGLDSSETRFFLPRTQEQGHNWTLGHPLERISRYSREIDTVPPRCLIPLYPDDPKARFRDELDEEALRSTEATGHWKSVKSLEQFWEMMAYRQECSSGRLTGFVWLVFEPEETAETRTAVQASSVPSKRRHPAGTATSAGDKDMANGESRPKKKKLTGLIVPRLPQIKRNVDLSALPVSSQYYYWPVEGRGEVLVDLSDYKRIVELLLHSAFDTLGKAQTSTARWLEQVAVGRPWGKTIVGKRPLPQGSSPSGNQATSVTNLSGLVRKKSKPASEDTKRSLDSAETPSVSAPNAQVTVLGAGLLKKKPKA